MTTKERELLMALAEAQVARIQHEGLAEGDTPRRLRTAEQNLEAAYRAAKEDA